MDHAIGAFFIIAGPVAFPIRVFHQLLEGFDVAFAEEIAGPLPAEHRARRIAPRRAVIGSVAGEEIEEKRRLEERPSFTTLPARENVAEQGLGFLTIEEVLLIRRALIGIAGRDCDPLDAE